MDPYIKARRTKKRSNQAGFIRGAFALAICSVLLVFGFKTVTGHAASTDVAIKSGISGNCLDDYRGRVTQGAQVDAWNCNGSSAQDWSVELGTIRHDDDSCLSVKGDGTNTGDAVVLNSCSGAPGQVWLRDQSGYFNPHSGLCLSTPDNEGGVPLALASCDFTAAGEQWSPDSGALQNTSCTIGTQGEKIACDAEAAWTTWQSGSPSHETLLTSYTDGAPYEEWCADFVSYIYKEAGYPFTNGEADGWDESNANNIQYMGFTIHDAANYTPQTGDVAFFDYPGGHVEIVVSGGKTPTFVYGDSATIDPTTGNGQMEANTITNDGAKGQVVYYLSPD